MKTLAEATDDARRLYFQEVLSQVPGTHIERSKAMGISVASYYRYISRLFPNLGPLLHKADYVVGSEAIQVAPKAAFSKPPLMAVAQPPAPVMDRFDLTESDLAPGPFLVRTSRNCATVTDVDWANREVDFTVGPMRKRQTIEDFLKHHIKAMV